MGRQRAAERDRQRKKRKLKRERRCESSDDTTNTGNEHGGAATSSISDGGTAAADVGRSGKKRRRRLRQQAAAAGRNAQVSTSTNETPSVSEETVVSIANGGSANHMQNIGEDGKGGIDADTPKANIATAAASETLEKDDDAIRIERMRLKKQQRKAAREAQRKKL